MADIHPTVNAAWSATPVPGLPAPHPVLTVAHAQVGLPALESSLADAGIAWLVTVKGGTLGGNPAHALHVATPADFSKLVAVLQAPLGISDAGRDQLINQITQPPQRGI